MNCKSIQEQLDLYAGGDLDGRESAQVAAHLKSCLACFRDFSELRDLLATVRSAGHDQGGSARGDAESEAFVGSVMREIHGPPPPAPQLIARLSFVSGWAAALLLGVTLGWRTLAGLGAGSAGGDAPPAAGPQAPNVIDRGSNDPRLSTIDYDVDAELSRQLDELRRRDRDHSWGGPSRSPVVPDGKPIKVRRNL